MAITFTGTNMTQVTHTTTNILQVQHTGTTVFTGLPVTVAPTLESRVLSQPPFGDVVQVRARNNDPLTALIRGFENPPSTSRGNISSNAWTDWISMGQGGFFETTAYATAQASGKNVSTISSIYLG